MRLHSFILTILITLTASCKKFLDVVPKGKLIPKEVSEFDKLLDNPDIVQYPFLDNNNGSILSYMTDQIHLTDGLGNINYKARNSANIERFFGYTFRAPYRNPNGVDYFWDWGTYRSMKYLNNVIDGIESIKNADNEADANRVLAQAYMNRAWAYFHTTLVYGPMYKPGGNNNAKTIPYVTSADVGADMPALSTQEEVFKLVLSDLHKALPYVPQTVAFPSRPNKIATQSMLAYYHLFTQRYDSVAYYANQAWATATAGGVDKVLYNYNQLAFADPVNLQNSAITSPDNRINLPNNREIIFFRSPEKDAGRIVSSTSQSYPSDEFIGLFNTATDLRYKFYFLSAPGFKTTYNGVSYDDGNRIQYFRGFTAGSTPKFQMTGGFTFPELLLMRAEGYARTNKLIEAMADLNLLRQHRYITGTPDLSMPATQDAVIQLIVDERRRELPIGHIKRFLDLKRFTLDAGKSWSKTKVVHQLGTATYEGVIDSPDFIMSISNNVLRFNPQWGIPLETRPFN